MGELGLGRRQVSFWLHPFSHTHRYISPGSLHVFPHLQVQHSMYLTDSMYFNKVTFFIFLHQHWVRLQYFCTSNILIIFQSNANWINELILLKVNFAKSFSFSYPGALLICLVLPSFFSVILKLILFKTLPLLTYIIIIRTNNLQWYVCPLEHALYQ